MEPAASPERPHSTVASTVIDGGCPLMFEPIADAGHRVLRFVATRTSKVPKRV